MWQNTWELYLTHRLSIFKMRLIKVSILTICVEILWVESWVSSMIENGKHGRQQAIGILFPKYKGMCLLASQVQVEGIPYAVVGCHFSSTHA